VSRPSLPLFSCESAEQKAQVAKDPHGVTRLVAPAQHRWRLLPSGSGGQVVGDQSRLKWSTRPVRPAGVRVTPRWAVVRRDQSRSTSQVSRILPMVPERMERGAGVGEVVVDVVAVAGALVSPGSVGVEGPVATGQLVRSIMTRMRATPSRPARWS
jgi:hypothetical protein